MSRQPPHSATLIQFTSSINWLSKLNYTPLARKAIHSIQINFMRALAAFNWWNWKECIECWSDKQNIHSNKSNNFIPQLFSLFLFHVLFYRSTVIITLFHSRSFHNQKNWLKQWTEFNNEMKWIVDGENEFNQWLIVGYNFRYVFHSINLISFV